MSNLKVNTINDASGGSAAVLYGVASPPNSMGFRNRLINSDMRIDQRNAGASVSSDGAYPCDRFGAFRASGTFTAQQSSIAPAGFTTSLLYTSTATTTTTYAGVQQIIEGNNIADFGWGSASAQSVTLSFWVRSSLTGTFGGSLRNSAANRSYVFQYTINAANTWEQKTVNITGDTSGTWLTTNGTGIRVWFDTGSDTARLSTAGAWSAGDYLGVTGSTRVTNTNGATFYITGVQLEAGTVATPFERRDYGRELMMCQRYFERSVDAVAATGFSTTLAVAYWPYLVEKRANPVVTPSGGSLIGNGGNYAVSSYATPQVGQRSFYVDANASGLVATGSYSLRGATALINAEL